MMIIYWVMIWCSLEKVTKEKEAQLSQLEEQNRDYQQTIGKYKDKEAKFRNEYQKQKKTIEELNQRVWYYSQSISISCWNHWMKSKKKTPIWVY